MDQTLSLPGGGDPLLAEWAGEGDDELAVIARLADDRPLPAGARVVTRFGDIATLRVPRRRLAELAESDAVAALEGPRPLRLADQPSPSHEIADPDAGTYVRRPDGVTATGKGVVVGVLDWGIDLAHPALRRADGSSRVLSLWDQRGAAGDAGKGANRWGYGRIFTGEEIDAALRADDPYAALGYHPADSDERDARDGSWKGAHGTHVLDIAAGNGRGGGLPGVAPESDIVFCHLSRTAKPVGPDTNLGDSATVLEALDFVFSVAGERPCVVNMSVGAHGGPHDGTSAVEQGIDEAVCLRSGRACVNSAGNYFASRAHAQGRVPPGGEEVIAFHVPASDPTDSELEIYYESADCFTVALIDPSGAEVARVAPGEHGPVAVAGTVVGHIYHRVRGVMHGDRHVDLFFRPQAPGGTWQLRLLGDAVRDGRWHAWIERDLGPRPRFLAPHIAADSTTGTLCNGKYSITVGAYDPHREGRPMAGFSSAGPTRDGRLKPEIAAPGKAIMAARSTPHGESPAARYVAKSGTSMAAPHVTGTIALMFEVAGRPLEIVETRALLFSSVDCPAPADGLPAADLHRIGHGYLNVAAAENAARDWGRQTAIETEESAGESPMSDRTDAAMLAPADTTPALDSDLAARGFMPAEAGDAEMPFFETAPEASDDRDASDDASAKGWTEELPPEDLRAAKSDGADEVADAGAAPPDFREAFLELVDGLAMPDAEDLRLAAMSLPGRAARERRPAPGSGEPPGLAHAGDLLVRAAPAQGIGYTAVVLADPEPPAALEARGVALERAGPGLYVEVAEVPAQGGPVRTVGRRLTDRFGRMPRGQTVLPAGSVAYGEDDPPPVTDPDSNPFAAWEAEQDSLVLLVGDDKLFILSPSRVGVVTPPARLRNIDWRAVVLRHDFGPLLGLPAVGAGGSRVFKAGPRLAVMLDAGRNPQRQPAAMYLPQLAATARDLNVAEVRAVILIHRHTDHFNELPAVVQQYGITAANVIMPQAYAVQETTRDYTNTVNALRRTFGANWRPARLTLRPATPAGDLLRGRYSLGELSFEFLADRAALRERRHADAASLLTRVTRRGDPGAIVVLGDLRGADLETFHNRMGPQAWREFFRNVEVIDGFSHHRGRLERADVPGIMRLLEATLLRTGRLVVTLQTDPGQHVQARADTLEFMRRIGVEVREVHVAGTAQPSGVRATTRGATAAGPHAQTHAPVPSALVDAVGRIGRLSAARETLVLWGPHIARQNPAFNQTAELRQIDQSLDELRRAVRGSVEAAARVRVSGGRTASGAQDYTSGTAGAAFVASLRGLPGTTPAETAIGPAGFAQIARMQRIPAREVPLFVALNDALVNGRYSREAFRYMVSQLDPAARRSIFTGPRGGPRAPHAVFRRLRAEFGFRQMLPGGLSVPSAAHLRPGARGAARGVAGALAVIEIGNLVAQGVQSYRIAQATAHRRNIAPFLRRLAFWRQLGVLSAAVAVDDPTLGSTTYERDPARIDTGLANGDWDFLYIEHTAQRPALSDAEILKVIAVLGHMIRNYDEYASLFEDSRQDAMRHVVTPGQPWWGSRWEVRVGNFSTSGTNHVAERWQELPLLGEGMNAIVRRVVANTTELLNRIGRGESAGTEALGTLQHPRGRVQYRARLRPGVATPVELRVAVPGQWGSGGSVRKIFHRVAWQTASRPEFFVWHVDGVDALVSGADFATYHRLRDLESEEYEIGTRGITLNALYSRKTGNQDGHAWMLTTDLERI